MRRFFSRLMNRFLGECLALVMFLAVAVWLWCVVEPRPEATFRVPVIYAESGGFGSYVRWQFSPDGSMVVAHAKGSGPDYPNNRFHVFNSSTGAEMYRTELFIRQVEWTQDQKLLLSCSDWTADRRGWVGKIMVLDPRTGTTTPCFEHPKLTWAKFLLAPDRNTLAIEGGGDGFEGFWLLDLPSGKEKTSTLLGPKEEVDLHSFSLDSRFFLVRLLRQDGGQLMLYDATQGKAVWQTSSFGRVPIRHAFSPDGRVLALCRAQDVDVSLWDTQTGKPTDTIRVGRAIAAYGATAQDKELDELFFLHGGAFLGVITSDGSPSRRGRRAARPPHRELNWPSSANFNLFEVRTGRLKHRQLQACNPVWDRTGTLIGLESKLGEGSTIRVHDLRNGRDHVWKIEEGVSLDACFGFIPWGGEREVLIYSKHLYEGRWGMQTQAQVGFLDPITGKTIDHWIVSFPATGVILSSDGTRMLAGRMEDGLDTFDLYSFPPRRPWLHILGWALLAGGLVELAGLMLRWRRARVVPCPSL